MFGVYECLSLEVVLDDEQVLSYNRDDTPEDGEGYLYISKNAFNQIDNINKLIKAVEDGKLLHLTDGDMIDIDEFCDYLISEYGVDFRPDVEKEWYSFKNNMGMSGDMLVQYWECYENNKHNKEVFLRKLREIPSGTSIKEIILSKKYDDFGMGMDYAYEDEIYAKILNETSYEKSSMN